jgi:hypothetical protein
MKYVSLLFALMTVLSLIITINSNFYLSVSSLVLSLVANDKQNSSNSESDNGINNKLRFSIYTIELAYAQLNDTSIPNNSINNSMHFYAKAADMPTARSEAAATNIGTTIYVIGGAPGALDIVEIYDVATDTWISSKTDGPSSVAPLPVGVNHGAATSYDGKLYVIGGFLEGRVASEYLFIYDPIENAWSRGADMPTPRAALTANFINGTLYAVTGTNENASALDMWKDTIHLIIHGQQI